MLEWWADRYPRVSLGSHQKIRWWVQAILFSCTPRVLPETCVPRCVVMEVMSTRHETQSVLPEMWNWVKFHSSSTKHCWVSSALTFGPSCKSKLKPQNEKRSCQRTLEPRKTKLGEQCCSGERIIPSEIYWDPCRTMVQRFQTIGNFLVFPVKYQAMCY